MDVDGRHSTQAIAPHDRGRAHLRLFAAGKPHREDRLTIVGSRFRGSAVTLGDLADDIQAKTETRMPFIGGPPPKRLKKLAQGLPIDSGTAVAYVDADVGLPARHRDPHRPGRDTVKDCVYDEVPKQLLHPSSVPGTLAIADDTQF